MHVGDVRDVMTQMIDSGDTFDLLVTSPPFLALRSYLLANIFTEWDRRYREEPRRFQSDFERILQGQTIYEYGEAAAAYFLEIQGDLVGRRF